MNVWALQFGVLVMGLVGAASAGEPPSKARLIAEVDAIHAGTPFALGVLVSLTNGWHTYWMNPGDSGMAPSVDWQLPEGFTAGPLLWPAPETIGVPPDQTYGYSDQMLLYRVITPPARLAADRICQFKASISWLICNDVCLPCQTNLEISLPVRDTPPAWSSQWHPVFERAHRDLPVLEPGWMFSIEIAGSTVTLAVTPPASVPAELLRQSRFYPAEPGLVDPSRAVWKIQDRSGRLTLDRLADRSSGLERLKGVLAFPSAPGGAGKRALLVDAGIAADRPKSTDIRN